MNDFAKRCLSRGAAVLMVLTFATACAETPQDSEVKKLLEQRLGENATVEAVAKTPYAGLYEVQSGGNIFYTDAKAQYLFVGQVLDAKDPKKNFTRERVDEINKVKFPDLPLDLAMKKVKGDGKRVIAVFSDPNCGYCKRFEQNLKEVDNVTVYTFMYNILSMDSAVKSRDIWCSADKNQSWENWMIKGKPEASAKADCNDPGRQVYELGKKLKVTGTPTIIFSDGSRMPGAADAKALEEKFATIK